MKFIVLSFLALFTFSHAAKIKISGSWFEKMTVLSQDGTTYKTVYTPISNKNNKNDKFNKVEKHEKEKPSQKSNNENGNRDAQIQVSPPVNVQTQILKEETKNSDSNINVIPVEIQKKQKQLKSETKNTDEVKVQQIISAKDDIKNINSVELPKSQIATSEVELYQNQKENSGQEAPINLVQSQPENTPVNSNLKEEITISVEPKEVNKDEIIKQEQLSSAFGIQNQIKKIAIDKQVAPNIAGSSSIQSSQQISINQAFPAITETKIVASGVETEKQGKIIDATRKKVQQMIQSRMSATASPFSVITDSDRKTISSSITDKNGNYVSDSTNRVQGKENYVNGTYNNVTGVQNSVENGHYNNIDGHFNKIVNGTNNVVSGNGAFIIGSNNKVYSS